MAAGGLIIVLCRIARGSAGYLTRTTDVLVRRHSRPSSDRDQVTKFLRAALVYGMAFGALVAAIGVVSLITGLRR
jgi:hypothetical protein